jgi:hypothetical protein
MNADPDRTAGKDGSRQARNTEEERCTPKEEGAVSTWRDRRFIPE